MSAGDKISNAAEGLAGKGKEALGDARGDNELKRDGQKDQTKSDLKQAGEKAKDALK